MDFIFRLASILFKQALMSIFVIKLHLLYFPARWFLTVDFELNLAKFLQFILLLRFSQTFIRALLQFLLWVWFHSHFNQFFFMLLWNSGHPNYQYWSSPIEVGYLCLIIMKRSQHRSSLYIFCHYPFFMYFSTNLVFASNLMGQTINFGLKLHLYFMTVKKKNFDW